MLIQDKTRQDKTRQDKTRQDKTRQTNYGLKSFGIVKPFPPEGGRKRFLIFSLLFLLTIGLIFSAQVNSPPIAFAASNPNQEKQNTDIFDKVWCFVTSCKKEEQKDSVQDQNDKKEVIIPTPSPRNDNKENDSQVLGLSSEDIEKSLSDLDGKVDLLFSYQQQTGNLIKNPSFEANSSGQPTFWSYTNESIEKNTFVNNAKIRSGANALRIEPKDSKTNFGIYQPSISTVFGRPYTLSLYISNQSGGNVTLRLGFWDRLGNKRDGGREFSVPVNTASSQVSVGKTGFTKYTYTLNPNSDIHLGRDYYPMIEVKGALSGNVYLDDISLTDNSGLGLFESKTTTASIGGGSVIIDDNANIYPVTTGTGSLGISNNKFTAFYLSKATIDKDGNLSIGGNADVDGTLTVDGNSTLSGTLGVSGATTLSSTLSVSGATTFNSVAYTWPSSQGASGSVLSNNGSGTLSWGTISASGITADSLDFSEFKDAMTLDATTNIAFAGFNLTTSGSGAVNFANSGTFTVAGATTLSTTLGVTGISTFTGNVNANGGFDVDDTFLVADGGGTLTITDNFWAGLGASAGRIEFDDQTTDEVNILDANVGIGTATPSYKLQVAGDALVSGPLRVSTATMALNTGDIALPGAIRFGSGTELTTVRGDVVSGRVDIDGGGGLMISGLLAVNHSGATAAYFRTGNVGIGTVTPGAKLQIDTATASTVGQIIKSTDNSTTNNLLTFQNSAGTQVGGFKLTSTTGAGQLLLGDGATITKTPGYDIFYSSAVTTPKINLRATDGGADYALFDNTSGVQTGTGLGFGWYGIGATIQYNSTTGNMLLRGLGGTTNVVNVTSSLVLGTAQLADAATDGFFYNQTTTSGAPSGTPTAFSGRVAEVYDDTNNKLYFYNGAWKSSTAYTDFAEWAPARGAEIGDIVSVTSEKNPIDDNTAPFMLGKSTKPYDSKVIGVVSKYAEEANMAYGFKRGPDYHTIALVGRVPVKVSTENGAITEGDYLTSSSKPGVAMKATKSGAVIGKAVESYSGSGVREIIVFVNIGYANPNDVLGNLDLALDGNGNLVNKHEVISIDVPPVKASEVKQDKNASGSANLQSNNENTSVNNLNVIGQLIASAKSVFQGMVEFLGNVIFKGDVTFLGKVTFREVDKDTAGAAVLQKETDNIDIKFEKEYDAIPIVNASISLDFDKDGKTEAEINTQKELEKQILTSQVTFLVTNKTKKGFTIKLNKTSPADIEFSWTALAVKDIKKTVGKPVENQTTQLEVQPSSSPTPTTSPVPSATPTVSPNPSTSPSPTPSSSTKTIKVLDNDLGFLRVREEPNADSKELGQVKPDQTFEVLDNQFGFYKIEYETGKTGWVSGTFVKEQ